MDCPKCGFTLGGDAADCPRCGIVVAKYRRAHDEGLRSPVARPQQPRPPAGLDQARPDQGPRDRGPRDAASVPREVASARTDVPLVQTDIAPVPSNPPSLQLDAMAAAGSATVGDDTTATDRNEVHEVKGAAQARVAGAGKAAFDPRLAVRSAEEAALARDAAQRAAANEARRMELGVRLFALPGALVLARFAVRSAPAPVRMLTMWVHESGHAVSAWICGYSAWPGPWFTPVASSRSFAFVVMLLGLIGYGGVQALKRSRWFWALASVAALGAVLTGTFALPQARAEQLITFGGDGGCFVLGSAMMLTMYARAEHPVRRDGLRWGLLVLGALAFMDVYAVWTGGFATIPLGENENGLSDPSVLTEIYGWSVPLLISRYLTLARWCGAVLAGSYIVGLAWVAARKDQA
jgi:hypothetical protein